MQGKISPMEPEYTEFIRKCRKKADKTTALSGFFRQKFLKTIDFYDGFHYNRYVLRKMGFYKVLCQFPVKTGFGRIE
jgi:hypothetical protein